MAHVIVGHCCKDASCLRVCPRGCIHPAPGDPDFDTAETLYIDPGACIDCTACVEACPAGAIKAETALTASERRSLNLDPRTHRTTPAPGLQVPEVGKPLPLSGGPLSVAVVGAGSAAMYTIRELLQRSSFVAITVFEQSGDVGGLLHTAVSADHPGIREMVRLFDIPFRDDRVQVRFGEQIGTTVTVGELAQHFDVVVFAHGAGRPREIATVTGERDDIHQAIDILQCANGIGDTRHSVRGPRIAVAGAGNVALDVVKAIVQGRVSITGRGPLEEITVLSRSDPAQAALTNSALQEVLELGGVDVVIDDRGAAPRSTALDPVERTLARLPGCSQSPPLPSRPRVTFSFGNNITALTSTHDQIRIESDCGRIHYADAVICALGFTTTPIDGLGTDARGAVLNHQGRVLCPETGTPIDGFYVVGWAKRGATGGVGDNRLCAARTIDLVIQDLARGVPWASTSRFSTRAAPW